MISKNTVVQLLLLCAVLSLAGAHAQLQQDRFNHGQTLKPIVLPPLSPTPSSTAPPAGFPWGGLDLVRLQLPSDQQVCSGGSLLHQLTKKCQPGR
jgi:hypothetical protein